MFGFGEKNKLEQLLNPASVAIVGASEKTGKVGNSVARNVLELGYAGKIFLVNPQHENLLGQKCYPSLMAVGEKIDLAIIVVPAEAVVEIIAQAADKIKNFIVISAGFAEIGEVGKKREAELQVLAKKNNLNILGPNCLGFINPQIKLNASFAGGMPATGNVALISQSGALTVAFLDLAKKEQVRFSSVVSIGNKACLDEADLIEYFAKDKATKVIGVYLEGIKDGEKFKKTLEKYADKKPIVILKAGKTAKAQKAIASHTGALAGSEEIIGAVFEKYGIIKAENLAEFFGLLKLLSFAHAPKNAEVLMVTNAGGPGVLITDAFQNKKIKPADVEGATKEKLHSFLPLESSVENPIDLLGDARADRYQKALDAVAGEKADTIICLLTPQDQTPTMEIADEIIAFKQKTEKNIATVFIGGEKVVAAVEKLNANDIVNFAFPEQAVAVLEKYYQWSQYSSQVAQVEKVDISRQTKVTAIIQKAQAENRSALYFSESAAILELYDITIVPTMDAENIDLARVQFPAVLKLDSVTILHKSDRQGVVLNIENIDELKKEIDNMRQNFPKERFIVQAMAEIQTEMIVGIKRDPIFGAIVVAGMGGIYAEIFQAVDFLVPPVSQEEIIKKLQTGKSGFLFAGVRGKNPYNVVELAEILAKVAQLAQENTGIQELDINPLLVYNNGKCALVADVKIIVN